MSRKVKIRLGIGIALVTLLVGTALAIQTVGFITGTIASYDFGGFGPGYPVPGTIQFQTFRMQPGESVPWHYHKALSYVVLLHGTLTEKHVVGPDQCESEQVSGGAAFVEGPNQVHMVTNTGDDAAVISWATVYPQSDGPGGIYFANAPNCQ
jgi:hypothetical protein